MLSPWRVINAWSAGICSFWSYCSYDARSVYNWTLFMYLLNSIDPFDPNVYVDLVLWHGQNILLILFSVGCIYFSIMPWFVTHMVTTFFIFSLNMSLTRRRGGLFMPIFTSLYLPNFSESSEHLLPIEYHIHIWHVLSQLSCGDKCGCE